MNHSEQIYNPMFFWVRKKVINVEEEEEDEKSIFLNNFLQTSPSLLQLWPSEKRATK